MNIVITSERKLHNLQVNKLTFNVLLRTIKYKRYYAAFASNKNEYAITM